MTHSDPTTAPAAAHAAANSTATAAANATVPASNPAPSNETVRLDVELVRRELARSRSHATKLIAAGYVIVGRSQATKPAMPVRQSTKISVTEHIEWASRAAHKLSGALAAFAIDPTGKRAVDAGASHGGFTDVLLRAGAAHIAAIDVGRGQLAARLATDPRVHVFDNTNIRYVDPATVTDAIGGPAQIVVADLSFISLRLVLPALIEFAAPDADLIPMVKPQFEVGKGRLQAHGVVRDPAARAAAVSDVAEVAASLGWHVQAAAPSPLPGPTGNIEYFLHMRYDTATDPKRRAAIISDAVFQDAV